MRKLIGVLLILIPTLALATFGSEDKVTLDLRQSMKAADAQDTLTVWVHFTDKGPDSLVNSYEPTEILSERSVERRRLRKSGDVIDFSDLPVNPEYIDEVASRVAGVRFPSRWFNALSVKVTKQNIGDVTKLDFVEELDVVRAMKTNSTNQSSGKVTIADSKQGGEYNFNYGPSLAQLEIMDVPRVHDAGNSGEGIMIGMFDSGFYDIDRPVFDSLNVVATHDFVDDKESVSPPPGSKPYGIHGMMTLSVIGGFSEGALIGPAYKADYVLARTEDVFSETPVEEDNWVRAIEWADSIGIDIANTSLGYSSYDDPYEDWTWKDMDGNSAIITKAADMAVSKGIIVVVSAGNSGMVETDSLGNRINPRHNTLSAPADGDSVITVGAVDSTGERAVFSSVGPGLGDTVRIKPDVMAPGASVVVAGFRTKLRRADGTSFSGPLGAGVVALVLEECPDIIPSEMHRALEVTATADGSPNYRYGWGVINTRPTILNACMAAVKRRVRNGELPKDK